MKKLFWLLVLFLSAFSVNAQQTTINEGFETWPPDGWSIYLLGKSIRGWIQSWDNTAHSGKYSAYSNISNDQCDNWLVSPQVSIDRNDYTFSFWDKSKNLKYYDKTSVLISTGSGDPSKGDFVKLMAPDTSTLWKQHTIDLSAYAGKKVYIAFRYQGTWASWYIDDVKIAPKNTYTDGALTKIVSPTGVSGSKKTRDVYVRLVNKGINDLQNITINWKINGIAQPPYYNTSQNISPGTTVDIKLGSFPFTSFGWYDISADLEVNNDIDTTNNIARGSFEVSKSKDGALMDVNPESMSTHTGLREVSVVIKNVGSDEIDSAKVYWSINGTGQPVFTDLSMGLKPGDTTKLVIGKYNFSKGLFKINARLDALGDTNDANNNYLSYAAIDTLWESFEGKVFPPEGWSFDYGTRDGKGFDPYQGDYLYSTQPDSNMFGVANDTLYTPLLDIKQGDRFKFYIRRYSQQPIHHSLVWKDGKTGKVHVITKVDPPQDTWQFVDYDISSAAGVNYIGIASAHTDRPGISNIDMITSDAKLHAYEHDLAIINGNIDFLAKQNVNENYTCVIRNLGQTKVSGSDYRLKLMEKNGNKEIASISGVDINPSEEISLSISHKFTLQAQHNLYFEIDYPADQDKHNNTFRATKVSVLPGTVVLNKIGSPDYPTVGLPFNSGGDTWTFGTDDLSQTVYLKNEFNQAGRLYGIIYNYDNSLMVKTPKKLPLKVWISETNVSELSKGWLPKDKLLSVFDDTIEILPGKNRQVFIPFDTIVNYTGHGNIVVQDFQYNPEFPFAFFKAYITKEAAGSPIRSVAVFDYFQLDPDNPPADYRKFSDFAFTTFVMDPESNFSSVSGTVYDTTGRALDSVKISVNGTSVNATTDASGSYHLPGLPYGNYNITAGRPGYYDSTVSVTLDTTAFILDFHLIKRLYLHISGNVYGNDDPDKPLQNVRVTALGLTRDSTLTDKNGHFTLDKIIGASSYKLKFSLHGYADTTIKVAVAGKDFDMGRVILRQEFISPFNVQVSDCPDAVVRWESPFMSDKYKFQNDFNVVSYSYTNSPNEEVWMGNAFSLRDTVTLTSVEIRTDIWPNANEKVTIDIFGPGAENILASSKPFIMYRDTVLTIDIPNIEVSTDFFAMVHWKDDPKSTNALAVDFSSDSVPNTAFIKYPGKGPVKLSDYIGHNAPNMSFLVRVNALVKGHHNTDGKKITYNIYRGLADEFPNTADWLMINPSPVSQLTYADKGWSGLQPGKYRYAVEAVYQHGTSEKSFSNVLEAVATGISDVINKGKTLLVYPVPAGKKLSIDFHNMDFKQATVQILDAMGKVLDEFSVSKGTGTKTWDISKYKNGIYFLRIKLDDQVINRKFIIRH